MPASRKGGDRNSGRLPPDDALLEKVKQLHQLGYQLALDDFTMSEDWERFLPFIHIIKFDLRSSSLLQIKMFIQRHKALGLTYLAEKVEDKAEFERVKKLGIQLFQGFSSAAPRWSSGPPWLRLRS